MTQKILTVNFKNKNCDKINKFMKIVNIKIDFITYFYYRKKKHTKKITNNQSELKMKLRFKNTDRRTARRTLNFLTNEYLKILK